MAKKEFSYKESMDELENILAEIDSEEANLDKLSEQVKRATFLVKECRKRLRVVSEEIDSILKDWEKD